ncbi:MAG: hypothetical protein M3Q63_02585 [bacterium]|nr:hypothetical protein [bacterium]
MEQNKEKFFGKEVSSKKKKIIVFTILGLFVIIFFIGNGGDTQPKAQNQVSSSVNVGEEGYIKAPVQRVLLGTTEEGYDNIIKASVAKDDQGLAEVVLKGEGYFVDNGIKVLVIDRKVGHKQIRVLEGEHISKTGWIQTEWITK